MSAAKKRLTELERLEIINQLSLKGKIHLVIVILEEALMLVKVQLKKLCRTEIRLKDDLLTCLSKKKQKAKIFCCLAI